MSPIQYRKTRFVCVSDTHNASPTGAFKLPKGDVLIHAGDLTNQGSHIELRKAIDWIEKADFEEKFVIAGNHDITLDAEFYSQHGLYFHNQYPQDDAACRQMLADSSINYLQHGWMEVTLKRDLGPRTTFKIFGSPYSPSRGLWAFGYERENASALWDQIPLDTDIVVTHTPPKYHCDESRDRGAAGCDYLRQTLWRVRPQLAICGHVHEGRGAERILWDLGAPNIKYKEEMTGYWIDPESQSKKQSLINLTAKGPAPLRNHRTTDRTTMSNPAKDDSAGPAVPRLPTVWEHKQHVAPKSEVYDVHVGIDVERSSILPLKEREKASLVDLTEGLSLTTRGQGGIPPSGRCDIEALSDRLDRRETCVINAAIMASSWPHKGTNGRKYNKPIVVDIDLPLWEKERH